MKSREFLNEGALSDDAEAKPFRMLAIYDSEEASREATHASNLVLRELGDGVQADRTTWNLRSLDTASVRTLAAEEAARADLIVLALEDTQPTATLKDWIARWQCNRELSSGLLALISPDNSETGGDLADYLYETAVTAHMDFLCQKKRPL
jgi:hypothetical protein